jgi:integrase
MRLDRCVKDSILVKCLSVPHLGDSGGILHARGRPQPGVKRIEEEEVVVMVVSVVQERQVRVVYVVVMVMGAEVVLIVAMLSLAMAAMYTLMFIMAVFNWATMADDGRGGVLLERNPFKGYSLPKEKNPLRVVLEEKEYRELLRVSGEVDWRFRVALILAHETGHRIGAIRKLQWSDIDLERVLIRWRAKNEKTGYEHYTPVTEPVQKALDYARAENPGIGKPR